MGEPRLALMGSTGGNHFPSIWLLVLHFIYYYRCQWKPKGKTFWLRLPCKPLLASDAHFRSFLTERFKDYFVSVCCPLKKKAHLFLLPHNTTSQSSLLPSMITSKDWWKSNGSCLLAKQRKSAMQQKFAGKRSRKLLEQQRTNIVSCLCSPFWLLVKYVVIC